MAGHTTRRALLASLGAGAGGLAGCLAEAEQLLDSRCPADGELARIAGDWPTRGRTPGHVGALDAGGFDRPVSQEWCLRPSGRWMSFVLADGTLYLTEREENDDSDVFHLLAVDARTGAERWRVELAAQPIGEPTVADGGVHLAIDTDESQLVRFAPDDGRREWRVTLETRTDSMVAVADGTVFATDVAGGVQAFDAATGQRRWHMEVHSEFAVGAFGNVPAVADGVVYVDAAIGTGPAALDAASGEVLWERDIPGFYGPVADGRLLLGGGTADDEGGVYALDAATGETRWSLDRAKAREADRQRLDPLVLTDDRVFVPLRGGDLEARTPDDGTLLWDRSFDDRRGARDLIATDGTLLYVDWVDLNHSLAGVATETGRERWEIDVDVDQIIAAEGCLFALDGSRLLGFDATADE